MVAACIVTLNVCAHYCLPAMSRVFFLYPAVDEISNGHDYIDGRLQVLARRGEGLAGQRVQTRRVWKDVFRIQ